MAKYEVTVTVTIDVPASGYDRGCYSVGIGKPEATDKEIAEFMVLDYLNRYNSCTASHYVADDKIAVSVKEA